MMSAPLPAMPVEGALYVDDASHVSGWCLWPDCPGARAAVEIVVDQHPVCALVAAQSFDGAGDGRHGFRLTLPAALSGPMSRVVEARELGSGTVFGRVLLFAEAASRPVEDRLARLDRAALGQRMPSRPPGPQVPLRRAFGAMADVLFAQAGGNALGRERNRLARQVPRLALSDVPDVSVIIVAAPQVETTLQVLTGLQALADMQAVELSLLDGGADPRTVLLVPLLRRLRYVRHAAGLTGGMMNLLAAQARGASLCFMDPQAPPGPWVWPLPGELQVGGAAARTIAALSRRRSPGLLLRRGGPHGFALLVSRAALQDAGGFDPELGFHDACADLVRKAGLLGLQALAWLEDAVP